MAFPRIFKGATLFWLLIIGIVVSFIVVAFFRLQPPKNRVDPTKIPQAVSVHNVSLKPLEIVYRTQGTVQSSQRIDMNPEVAGIVQTIHVHEGQQVNRGQALISLKAPRQAAQLSSSRAARQSIGAQIESQRTMNDQLAADLDVARSNAKLAEREYADFNTLFEQDVISRLERDQKLNAVQTARARVTRIQQQIRQNKSDIARLNAMQSEAAAQVQYNQAAMAESVIRAPFSGTIGTIKVDPGDYVMPAEAILTLVNGDSLEVSFFVPEHHAASVKTGHTAYIETDASDQTEPARARVTYVSPNIDPETRTLQVKATAPSSSAYLTDGQFVRVGLVLRTQANSITIPEEALIPQGEAQYVYIASPPQANVSEDQAGWRATFKKVSIGQRNTGWVQVIEGLKQGDLVITNNQLKLFDGAPLIDPLQGSKPAVDQNNPNPAPEEPPNNTPQPKKQ